MSDELNSRTYDAALVGQSLAQLHEFVTRCDGRIEITRAGSEERCILLSKRELDSLEHALEILSKTDDMRGIREIIAQLAAATSGNVCVSA